MIASDKNEITEQRKIYNIESDLKGIESLLKNDNLTDIFVSHEGKVSIKCFGKDITDEKLTLSISTRFQILNEIAKYMGLIIDFNKYPVLESTIPVPIWENARITGVYPPWVVAPEFTIRRPPKRIYTLEEYVENNQLSKERYDIIVNYIKERKNIVIAGSTGSGKTTMVNALILQKQHFYPNDRYFIVQDTAELQCSAKYKTMIILRPEQAMLGVSLALRYAPNTIIFGEVRKGEVMAELLDAWNTGHPGGITTIHANSSILTLTRIKKLLFSYYKNEASMPDLNEYIDLIIYIQKDKKTGIVVNDVMELKKQDKNIEAMMESFAKMDFEDIE